MKTIKITRKTKNGFVEKEYVTVNERIKAFRTNFPNYCLTSEIVELTPEACVIKAIITDDKGVIRATGLAQECRKASMINETSYVENCETSAWGRALGNFGIGVDESICSADELLMALNAQKEEKTPVQSFHTLSSSVKSLMTKEKKTDLTDEDLEKKAKSVKYTDEEVAVKTQGAIDFFNDIKENETLQSNDARISGAKILIKVNEMRGNETAAEQLKQALDAFEKRTALNDSIPY